MNDPLDHGADPRAARGSAAIPEAMHGHCLLTTAWLQAFDDYLDYRIRQLAGSSMDRLLVICRTFATNPLAIWRIAKWFIDVAPNSNAGFRRDIPVEISNTDDIRDVDCGGDVRTGLKNDIEAKLQHLTWFRQGPGVLIAHRVSALAYTRRNLFRALQQAFIYRARGDDLDDDHLGGPAPTVGVNLQARTAPAGPAESPALALHAPGWLRRQFAGEYLHAGGPGDDPAAVIVCVGDENHDPAPPDPPASTPGARAPRICWHYGDALTAGQVGIAKSCDHVFAASADLAASLQKEIGAPVEHLPPAVNPRIHNPVGSWDRQPGGDPPPGEPGMPQRWRDLVRAATGWIESPGDNAGPGAPWMDEPTRNGARKLLSVRHVLMHETMSRRLDVIGQRCGRPLAAGRPPLVSLVVSTKRPRNLDHVFETVSRQSYEHLELVLVLHDEGFDEGRVAEKFAEAGLRGRFLEAPAKWTLGECLNHGCENAHGSIICKLDDDNMYGEHYVSDMIMWLTSTEAAVAGKSTLFRWFPDDRLLGVYDGSECSYTARSLSGGTLTFNRDVLGEVAWRPVGVGEDRAFCADCFARAIPSLAADRFNYVSVRGQVAEHTWKVNRDTFSRKLRYFPRTAEPHDVLV